MDELKRYGLTVATSRGVDYVIPIAPGANGGFSVNFVLWNRSSGAFETKEQSTHDTLLNAVLWAVAHAQDSSAKVEAAGEVLGKAVDEFLADVA